MLHVDRSLNLIHVSLRRRANAQNISSRISLWWPIHIINPVDKTKLSGNTPHWRSTTVSLETYPLHSMSQYWLWIPGSFLQCLYSSLDMSFLNQLQTKNMTLHPGQKLWTTPWLNWNIKQRGEWNLLLIVWGAGMAQWWDGSPPTLLWGFFSRFSDFLPSEKTNTPNSKGWRPLMKASESWCGVLSKYWKFIF